MLFYSYNPILIAAAVVPAVILLFYIYRADRLDKEPLRLLLSLILLGVISTGLALVTERLGLAWTAARYPEDGRTRALIENFVVVALSEEGFKYLLLWVRTWRDPEFNCQFDAVVYAVFVSLGFALWENISYVLEYGFSTAMIRAVTAVPGHACFGVFMGAWYGLAKRYYCYGKQAQSKFCRWLAVLLPALLHGAYDYIATSEGTASGLYFAAFVAVLFVISFLLIRKLSRKDRFLGHSEWYS